ncbi:hypothetical protein [Litorivivens sp.]|uniref:hypothetical protein n=1 Tax=Litorivivens sp. TaxID=2020868 RepID=UPI003568F09D
MQSSLFIYFVSAINLAFSVLSIRVLSESYGQIVLTTWFLVFSGAQYILTSTGSVSSVISAKRDIHNNIVGASIFLGAFAAIGFLAFYLLGIAIFIEGNFLFVLALGGVFFSRSLFQVMQSLSLSRGKVIEAKTYDLIFVIGFSAPFFLLYFFNLSLADFVLALLCAGGGIFLSGLIWFRVAFRCESIFSKSIFKRSVVREWWGEIGRGGVQLFPAGFAAALVWNSDNFVLTALGLGESINEYNALFRVFILVASVSTLLAPVMLVGMKEKISKARSYIFKAAITTLSIGAVVLLFVDVVVQWLISSEGSVDFLLALLIMVYAVIFSVNSVLVSKLIVLQGFAKITLLSASEAGVNLIFSIVIGAWLGAIGVAIGSIVGASVGMIGALYVSRS